jgi:ABC-type polar amino acid transport system ATPase subunit
VARDIRAAIMGGRLIALTTGIGSGKTVLSRQLRADLEREGRVIVSRSLSIDKVAALFDDLTPGEDGQDIEPVRRAGARRAGAVSGAPRSPWRCSSTTRTTSTRRR